MKISMVWITSLILVSVFTMAIMGTKKMEETKMNSWTQFECGFSSASPTSMPFSFQFFMISLLFLIFDVEIALVLSFPMEPQTTKNVLLIFLFVTILAMGLTYEWQKSKLEWSKWMG